MNYINYRLTIAALAVVGIWPVVGNQTEEDADTSLPRVQVPHFAVQVVTFATAVKQLCNETGGKGFGLEVVPEDRTLPADTPTLISLEVEDLSVGEILDELVAADPRYVWEDVNGFINVYPVWVRDRPDYPLNRTIAEFRVASQDPVYALLRIYEVAPFRERIPGQLWLYLPDQWRGDSPLVTLHLQNVPLRQVLNEVARAAGQSWMAEYVRHLEGLQVWIGSEIPLPRTVNPASRARWKLGLDWPIERFQIHEVALITALKQIAQRVPRFRFGFDNIVGQSLVLNDRPLSLTMEHATVRDIIAQLIALDGRFHWEEHDGFINIWPIAAEGNPQYLTNRQLPDFTVSDLPPDEAVFLLLQRPELEGNRPFWPGEGRGEDRPDDEGQSRAEAIFVRLDRPSSVRGVLNALAGAADLSWILRSSTPQGYPWLSLGRDFELPRTSVSRESSNFLDTKVKTFAVDNLTVPTAIVLLGNALANFRYGLECPLEGPGITSGKRVSVRLENASLRAILDRLTALDPNYVWEEKEGFVSIRCRQSEERLRPLLDQRLARFCLLDALAQDALVTLLDEINSKGHGVKISLMEGIPRADKVFVAIDEKDVPAREVLNRLVALSGYSWLIHPDKRPEQIWLIIGEGFGIPAEAVERYTIEEVS
jgi:hypothetical protein